MDWIINNIPFFPKVRKLYTGDLSNPSIDHKNESPVNLNG
jgi:hypothetical protein